MVVYVYYALDCSRDNQSMTYLKAHERILCVRSGRSKKLVEINRLEYKVTAPSEDAANDSGIRTHWQRILLASD